MTEAPRGSRDELIRHFLADERFEDFVDAACDDGNELRDLVRREEVLPSRQRRASVRTT